MKKQTLEMRKTQLLKKNKNKQNSKKKTIIKICGRKLEKKMLVAERQQNKKPLNINQSQKRLKIGQNNGFWISRSNQKKRKKKLKD